MVPPVFKTGEIEYLGLAGSIPVRLRVERSELMGDAVPDDPRRLIPRTDRLLALPAVAQARESLGEATIRAVIYDVQDRARSGEVDAADVELLVTRAVRTASGSSLTPVLNATGVVVHTNLGRAPLSTAATAALVDAAGYVDVEMDLRTGKRSGRGVAARQALLRACPPAESALIVNNGAAALLLAVTALSRGDIVVSRGELVEIGAGFRLPDLMTSTGLRLCEVGTTNRTHLRDYADACAAGSAGCIVKIHPSNFRVEGFTSAVDLGELRELCTDLDLPLIADLGSGLLTADAVLPDEPDAASALQAGADLVICSGDKLLGGPQAGIILGRSHFVDALAAHPLARAVRADKLSLAALEATLSGPTPPTRAFLHADTDELRRRTETLAAAVGGAVVAHDGRVGGGGGAGVSLGGWALRLPAAMAAALRQTRPAIVTRVHDGYCLVDLRCVPAEDDARVIDCIRAVTAAERR